MGSRKKGSSREVKGRAVFQEAGFRTEKSVSERYGRTDWFGLFDFMAIRTNDIRFLQVKHESAKGIKEMQAWIEGVWPSPATYEYLVYHKREGWRLIRVYPDRYETLYDERKDERVGAHRHAQLKTGQGLTDFLARDD